MRQIQRNQRYHDVKKAGQTNSVTIENNRASQFRQRKYSKATPTESGSFILNSDLMDVEKREAIL